jgi:hypothetical protein
MPAYAVVYLEYGHDSAFTPEDIRNVDGFMAVYYEMANQYPGGHVFIDYGEEESYFTWSPAFGLACDVYDATITILANESEE